MWFSHGMNKTKNTVWPIHHSYLKEINIASPDEDACSYALDTSLFYKVKNYFFSFKRRLKCWRYYKKHGVIPSASWTLDYSLLTWLYENLMEYEKEDVVDLEYHKFIFEGREYTQLEMIHMLKEELASLLSDYYTTEDFEKSRESEKRVFDIWYTISRAMWW